MTRGEFSEKIPKTQLGWVFDDFNAPLELREIPVPDIDHDDILVHVLYSGVCHTDLHAWKGDFPVKPKEFPVVGGHEGAGIVVKLGSSVKNFKLGDRAGVKWLNGSCLTCEQCRRGFENNCTETKLSGLTRDGSFQQYAAVKATEATPIADNLDLTKVAPILCAGVTAYTAMKETNARAGQIVAITGAGGGLGSLAVQYGKAMGFRILAIDHPRKEEHCKRMGAEFFIDYMSKNLVDDVVRLTNGGPHCVACFSPHPDAMTAAAQYVRTRGTVVLIALPKGKAYLDVFWHVIRCITVKGSYVGRRQDAIEALEFLERGQIDVPVEVLPFKELPAVYERMSKQEIPGRIVLKLPE